MQRGVDLLFLIWGHICYYCFFFGNLLGSSCNSLSWELFFFCSYFVNCLLHMESQLAQNNNTVSGKQNRLYNIRYLMTVILDFCVKLGKLKSFMITAYSTSPLLYKWGTFICREVFTLPTLYCYFLSYSLHSSLAVIFIRITCKSYASVVEIYCEVGIISISSAKGCTSFCTDSNLGCCLIIALIEKKTCY